MQTTSQHSPPSKRPTMNRRHYLLIARILSQNLAEAAGEGERRVVEQIARDFAAELAGTNPNFESTRFLRACGLEASNEHHWR
jgi:hypothetical protein